HASVLSACACIQWIASSTTMPGKVGTSYAVSVPPSASPRKTRNVTLAPTEDLARLASSWSLRVESPSLGALPTLASVSVVIRFSLPLDIHWILLEHCIPTNYCCVLD